MSAKSLTASQLQLYRYIVTFWGDNTVYPTMREMADAMGFSSTNGVEAHLRALIRKGFIEREKAGRYGGGAPTIRVVEFKKTAKVTAEAVIAAIEFQLTQTSESHDTREWDRAREQERVLLSSPFANKKDEKS